MSIGIVPAYGQSDLSGAWLGAVSLGGTELRIVFHLNLKDGAYSGTLDSIDQGVSGFPIDEVRVEENHVVLTVRTIAATFDGAFDESQNALVGTWSQAGANIPLTLKRTDEVPRLARPQEPKPPFPYASIDVAFDHATEEGVRFSGTLTVPEGEGPFPGVLLITGSGPQDRDESILGHKPFLVLSDYLTRRGIAVLRVDDRGTGESTGNYADATTATFATDAAAGFHFLRARDEVDPERVGLLGHSEGAQIAPLVANENEDVAFVILLAGPAVSGLDILLAQSELIARAGGMEDAGIAMLLQVSRGLYEVLGTAESAEAARAAAESYYEGLTAFEKTIAGYNEVSRRTILSQVSTPWFRAFLSYDPRGDLQGLRCPVYAAYGELDLQVPPAQNVEVMRSSLTAAPIQDFTVEVYPGLNHLFQHATTGAPSEYASIEETMSPELLKNVGDWSLTRFGPS